MSGSWLRLIHQKGLPVVLICGGVLPWASGQTGPHPNKIVGKALGRQGESSGRGGPRLDAPPNAPENDGQDLGDFGEELLQGLVSTTASGFINAGLQGGLDWLSFRRDPAQGLADPYVQNVIRLKQSASAKVRVKAAVGLLRIPSPAASKPFLKEALKNDPSEDVRKTCAIALGRIGDEDCRDYLQKAMKYDSSPKVRLVCSAVLTKCNGAGTGRAVGAGP